MDQVSREGLIALWASDGTESALAAGAAIRRWVIPAFDKLEILTVAPVGAAFSKRMTRWTASQRSTDLRGAELAAQRSLEALGDVGLPTEVHVRWGSPSEEIARQARISRVSLLILGPGARNVGRRSLGRTAEEAVFGTTKSVLIARTTDKERDSVVVLHNTQPKLTSVLSALHALRLASGTRVRLMALMEPVKPFGSMLPSFNDAIRDREQAAHDLHAESLLSRLESVASNLRAEYGLSVETQVEDCEPNDILQAVGKAAPSLVIAGDDRYGDPDGKAKRTLLRLVAGLDCSVLIAR